MMYNDDKKNLSKQYYKFKLPKLVSKKTNITSQQKQYFVVNAKKPVKLKPL